MSTKRLIFEHQAAHLAWLIVLLAGLYGASHLDGFAQGRFLGITTCAWVGLNVANAVVHQVFVWICWRTELYAGLLTKHLGDAAFRTYAAIFTLLILARPVLITALAISNRGSMPGNTVIMRTSAVVLLLPGVYLIYSIRRYFGFRRAFGIDHFDTGSSAPSGPPGSLSDDPPNASGGSDRMRRDVLPLVRQGIFRFSSNAMYDFGFLLLWVPGLYLQSVAAVVTALFCHLYIWVHYACTEKPDMRRIYGG